MKTRLIPRVTSLAPRLEFFFLLALVLLRLYLTADRDIAAWNAPHDEFWYVHKAFIGVWAGQYNEMSFVHSPLYALWLELLNTYGVPARFGIDIAWTASVIILANAVRKTTNSRMASVMLAGFLLLHPYSIFIFDRSLAETLLSVTITFLVATGLEIWNSRDAGQPRRRAIAILLFSLLFAVACNIRREGISLIASLLFLAGLSFFFRKSWWSGSARLRPSLGLIAFVFPIVATLSLGLALSSLNYLKWGSFAQNDLSSADFESALSALSRIDAGQTPVEVSISQEMLDKAYSVSPTFNALRPQLKGEVGQRWMGITKEALDVKGEIGTGWFYWALREAAADAGWHSTASHANEKYRAVSAEVNRAFEKGVLIERSTVLPVTLDPDFRKWLPVVPTALVKIIRIAVLPSGTEVLLPAENATSEQFAEYTWVVGRRNPGPDSVQMSKIGYVADGATEGLLWFSRILGLLFVACLLAGVLFACFKGRVDHIVVAALACAVFCMARVALFALLEASSWNGEQARYMLPLLPFFACAGVFGMATLHDQLRALTSHSKLDVEPRN